MRARVLFMWYKITNTSIRQDDDRRYNRKRFAGVPGMVPGFPREPTRGRVSNHNLHDWPL